MELPDLILNILRSALPSETISVSSRRNVDRAIPVNSDISASDRNPAGTSSWSDG